MELTVGVNKGSITNTRKPDGTQPLDGPIVCTATPDGIVHLEVNPDGTVVDVIPVAPGVATYSTSADADPGPGVVAIEGNTITITVIAAPVPLATTIESVEGPVVPQ